MNLFKVKIGSNLGMDQESISKDNSHFFPEYKVNVGFHQLSFSTSIQPFVLVT